MPDSPLSNPPTPVSAFWRGFAQGCGLGGMYGGALLMLAAALVQGSSILTVLGLAALVVGGANYIVWRSNDV